jgi:hypothetical protein
MEALQNLPPIVGLILGFIAIAWLVLVFLVPFMIEGIRQSTRKTYEELAEMNDKLDRLNALLTHGRAPANARGRAEPPASDAPEPRGRKEPTISETAVRQTGRRERREPVVR